MNENQSFFSDMFCELVNRSLWLESLLSKNSGHKLTSKDKLVVSYVYLTKFGVILPDRYFCRRVSYESGLAERTVQKSFARLVNIKAISLQSDGSFLISTDFLKGSEHAKK